MSDGPYIRSVTLRNVAGIIYLKLDLGQFTVLKGRNESGKSSVIKGIRTVFSGGYDPTIVRDPAAAGAGAIIIGEPPVEGKRSWPSTKAKGEIELSDGSRIIRTVDKERKTSTVEVLSADGQVIKAPQAYLDDLCGIFALDPVSFLKADPKDRAKAVMQFLYVEITRSELIDAAGPDDWYIQHFRPAEGAFSNIDRIETAARERRREAGRERDRILGAINTLQKQIPTLNLESRDWRKEASDAERAFRETESAYKSDLKEMETQSAAARQQAHRDVAAKLATVDEWERTEIARIKQEAETKRATHRQEQAEAIADIERLTAEERQKIEDHHQPIVRAAETKHREAQTNLEAYNNADGLRKLLADQEQQMKAHAERYREMDEAIAGLLTLRKEKMNAVPIPGLEMRDGEVYFDGLRLDALNKAKSIEVAVQIVALAAGRMKFMFLDDSEGLDSETFEGFVNAAVANGFQIVTARVADTPLKVEQLV